MTENRPSPLAAVPSPSPVASAGGGVRRPILEPVDYSRRIPYRRPSPVYLRFQWLGFLLTRLGLSPGYVVLLEVPGRRTGVIRRNNLVRAVHGGGHYLVALGGESEWVRNVRAAGGRVTIGRRVRRAATLHEIPVPERPAVIRSYILRAGRRPGSRSVTREARFYFGVDADLSDEQLAAVAPHYPVFRIVYAGDRQEPR